MRVVLHYFATIACWQCSRRQPLILAFAGFLESRVHRRTAATVVGSFASRIAANRIITSRIAASRIADCMTDHIAGCIVAITTSRTANPRLHRVHFFRQRNSRRTFP